MVWVWNVAIINNRLNIRKGTQYEMKLIHRCLKVDLADYQK